MVLSKVSFLFPLVLLGLYTCTTTQVLLHSKYFAFSYDHIVSCTSLENFKFSRANS